MVTSRRRTEQYRDADFSRMVPAETLRVRQLYAEGVLQQIWHRADGLGACFVLEAKSLNAARGVVDSLPMAGAGLVEFTVLELKPYRGFCPGRF
ncbi:MAG TPA: hypothetical protein VHX38_16930 [Pseudonocardiaceae bacterium]|jgi:muconolactone delta-isomerase|nr:hypothetical protein [Pseudonocardiaceae bacterium]